MIKIHLKQKCKEIFPVMVRTHPGKGVFPMTNSKSYKKVYQLVLASLFAALTYVMTMVVQVPSPMQGYVNLGDCAVLLSAWLLGPLYGGAAAGIGSMLADLLSGYAHYAPGTFAIKLAMAVAAALIFRALQSRASHNLLLSQAVSGVVAEIIMVVGYFGYAGLLLGKGIGAAASIPGNLVQAAMGLAIGLILFTVLKRSKALDKLALA